MDITREQSRQNNGKFTRESIWQTQNWKHWFELKKNQETKAEKKYTEKCHTHSKESPNCRKAWHWIRIRNMNVRPKKQESKSLKLIQKKLEILFEKLEKRLILKTCKTESRKTQKWMEVVSQK